MPACDTTFCRSCGGQCCREWPAPAIPRDFGAPDRRVLRRRLESALACGEWVIDWWYGDARQTQRRGPRIERSYVVRPRAGQNQKAKLDIFQTRNGQNAPCVFSSVVNGDATCVLGDDERPANCKALMSSLGGSACGQRIWSPVAMERRRLAAVDWLPYRTLLAEVASKVSGIPVRDILTGQIPEGVSPGA